MEGRVAAMVEVVRVQVRRVAVEREAVRVAEMGVATEVRGVRVGVRVRVAKGGRTVVVVMVVMVVMVVSRRAEHGCRYLPRRR